MLFSSMRNYKRAVHSCQGRCLSSNHQVRQIRVDIYSIHLYYWITVNYLIQHWWIHWKQKDFQFRLCRLEIIIWSSVYKIWKVLEEPEVLTILLPCFCANKDTNHTNGQPYRQHGWKSYDIENRLPCCLRLSLRVWTDLEGQPKETEGLLIKQGLKPKVFAWLSADVNWWLVWYFAQNPDERFFTKPFRS